jgi:hypothetical protein
LAGAYRIYTSQMTRASLFCIALGKIRAAERVPAHRQARAKLLHHHNATNKVIARLFCARKLIVLKQSLRVKWEIGLFETNEVLI